MKAIAKCPKCKETITTNCGGCISGETYNGKECKCNEEVIENVKWEKVPETEQELNEIEEE